jgi:hypothetical protein
MGLLPAVRLVAEPEPQRIVVLRDDLERSFEPSRVHVRRRREEEGLIPVMGLGQAQLKEPALDRSQECHPLRRRSRGPGFRRRGQTRGQLGHGRPFEQIPWREGQALGAGASHDLDAQDRIAAQLEEVVVDAQARHGKDRRPDSAQRLLHPAARSHVGGAALGPRGVGGRQRLPIHLPVLGEGQPIDEHESGGDHVLRDCRLQPRAQLVDEAHPVDRGR